ncbi:MAG TPA: bacillithiol biosynthesis BshC, partial [Saprospiraceae bacterium]|nr:bacillithiol biosynthesis BshC [Saprospiraceae bacterium]
IRRNSVAIIDITTLNRLTKAGIEVSDLQYPFEKIEQDYLRKNSEMLDFSEYEKSINTILEQMYDMVQIYDQNSTGRLMADKNMMVNKITEWEKKLNKQIILKHETKLNQMKSAYEKIFPGQNLQERTDSCIWLIAHFGTEIISFLVHNLNPLDRQFMYLVQQPDVE